MHRINLYENERNYVVPIVTLICMGEMQLVLKKIEPLHLRIN